MGQKEEGSDMPVCLDSGWARPGGLGRFAQDDGNAHQFSAS
jgi:hypothetical protein